MIPELSLSQIKARGYREDDPSRRAFERRYRWITAPAIAVGFGSVYLFFTGRLAMGVVCLVGSVVFCLGAAYQAARATPLSCVSGRAMQRFRRADSIGERTEYIYVDDASRTYFVRLISRPSSNPPP